MYSLSGTLEADEAHTYRYTFCSAEAAASFRSLSIAERLCGSGCSAPDSVASVMPVSVPVSDLVRNEAQNRSRIVCTSQSGTVGIV